MHFSESKIMGGSVGSKPKWKGLKIREDLEAPVICGGCGTTNRGSALRCHECLAPLNPAPAGSAQAPRTVNPIIHSLAEVDALFGELEALTREDDAASLVFQCPSCGRVVDGTAMDCSCGVRFAE